MKMLASTFTSHVPFYWALVFCIILLQLESAKCAFIGTAGTPLHGTMESGNAISPQSSFAASCKSAFAFIDPDLSLKQRQTYSRLLVEPPRSTSTAEKSNPNVKNQLTPQEEETLSQTFGGYTVKQRLREEVESPFRKVRLLFFASSAGSALTALYFSSLSALKAYMGGYSDAPPLDEALTSCAINLGGAIVCALLAYRDYQVGQTNLERIARGGKLAKLAVAVVTGGESTMGSGQKSVRTLSEYRRNSRVLICAGGKEYIENICRSLNSDQRSDDNTLPRLLEDVNVLVVPVCLTDSFSVDDTKQVWRKTLPSEKDRNFDSTRSDSVVAFPWNSASWTEYLQSEIDTARKQGFDVLTKGITILVKKNGKILRRATGTPNWDELIGTMEVMDGSRFGMPGDSERYGGP